MNGPEAVLSAVCRDNTINIDRDLKKEVVKGSFVSIPCDERLNESDSESQSKVNLRNETISESVLSNKLTSHVKYSPKPELPEKMLFSSRSSTSVSEVSSQLSFVSNTHPPSSLSVLRLYSPNINPNIPSTYSSHQTTNVPQSFAYSPNSIPNIPESCPYPMNSPIILSNVNSFPPNMSYVQLVSPVPITILKPPVIDIYPVGVIPTNSLQSVTQHSVINHNIGSDGGGEKGYGLRFKNNNNNKKEKMVRDKKEVDVREPLPERYIANLCNEIMRQTDHSLIEERKNPNGVMWMASKVEMTQKELIRKSVEQRLKLFLKDNNLEVHFMGGALTGICPPDSCVDLSVVTAERCDLETITNILKEERFVFENVCVDKRIRVVKLRVNMTITCCLSLNDYFGVRSSHLQSLYCQIDNRFRILSTLLKVWAKSRRLSISGGGSISSYVLVLMMLNFLQRRNPPVLPNLQSREIVSISKTLFKENVGRTEILYSMDTSAHLILKSYHLNVEPMGVLLVEFFRYYSIFFNYEEQCISVKRGQVIPKADLGWKDGYHPLAIEDPFVDGVDVGDMIDPKDVNIFKNELNRALNHLLRGLSFHHVCQFKKKFGNN